MTVPLQRYPDVDMPFERVHMVLVGPKEHSEREYEYSLVLIDVLTRYLIAELINTYNYISS